MRLSYLLTIVFCLLAQNHSLGQAVPPSAGNAAQQFKSAKIESLDLKEQIRFLSAFQSTKDRVDKKKMSIRWTGQLRVPAAGTYTFEQLRSLYGGSRAALWVNGKMILDSRQSGQFQSEPVAIETGAPVDFRLDFVHDSSNSGDFPTAIITWQSEVLEKQMIPSDAFLNPDGKKGGLKGEYFFDARWTRKSSERIDEAVDFIWDSTAVDNGFAEDTQKLAKAGFTKAANELFLTSLKPEDKDIFTKQFVPLLLGSLRASERIRLSEILAHHPELLKGIPLSEVALSAQAIGLLSNDRQINFLLAWAKENPQPRCVPGSYIAGSGTYTAHNVEPFNKMGRAFRSKETFENTLKDEENSVVLPSGECNLTLLYALVNAGKQNGSIRSVLKVIDEKLADNDVSGNVKMTWLLAKAYVREVGLSQQTKPGRGLPELREALAVAEGQEYRFWAFQELLARLVTLNQKDEAQSLISGMKDQFPEPAKQAFIEQCHTSCEQLDQEYSSRVRQMKKNTTSSYASELTKRGNIALQKGDNSTAQEMKRRAALIKKQ